MQLLRASERKAAPWKNGGGVTREVAAGPSGAGFDNFDWRISIADVATDGPFSSFPDVDRLLAVLEGRLRLSVAGQPAIVLDSSVQPAAFPGDVIASAVLDGGPVLDLNVMSRRGRIRAGLRRLDVLLPQIIAADAEALVVVAGHVALRVITPRAACDLDPYDAVLFERPTEGLLIEAAKPAVAYVATFNAAGA
jgi:environmental stress-induced protein Ves